MSQKEKKYQVIQLLGLALFIAGFTTMYFEWPVNHPIWVDLVGLSVSFLAILAPHKIVPMIEKVANKYLSK